ncbi:caspase family protein, partial [bacterium]|nr:caspase family protein [bacterium]
MRLYKKNRRVVIYGMKILLAIGILLNEGLLLAESSESEVVELFRYGQVQRNPNAYTIGKKGGVFLKIIENKKDQCLKLDQSGNYPIEKLNEELLVPANASGFFNCNLRALISRLKTPAQMLITPEPRGLSDGEPKEDVVFEDIWRQVAVEMSAKVPAENMLAAAVWYSGEKRNFARSAYILEKAHNYYHNNWFLELHHDAYALTSPTLIDQEIQKTKSEYLDIYSKNNKIALLTGIQNYVNSAEWPELQTPLRDIEKLKDVLVREYNYDPDNIIMLPNATYQGLLDALR